ncbi:hypothetical protein GOV10_06705, partial [Candidatus Woesearchaeota archaeon]|nr:hypothetical protein [Candidatus Woesearchaeota archaeon]
VVNERGDTPFGLIGIQYWHGGDHEWKTILREAPVEIIDTEEFPLAYTPEVLRLFMDEQVSVNGAQIEKEV